MKGVSIDGRGSKKDIPFFLYVPFGSPHSPIAPSPEWKGKSGLGAYADFVMQTDAGVGSIMQALKRNGLAENTLDGCSKNANIPSLAKKGHLVSAGFRGSKADLWDGGHHIPFIMRWPGNIAPDSSCDQLICLTDFFASLGEIRGVPLPDGSAEDSLIAQLYDMENDPAETTNLYESHPEVVKRLLEQLESDVQRGRCTDGAAAKNDTEKIKLWKKVR